MSKNSNIDFQAIKARVRIDQAATMLGLRMAVKGDQARGRCPSCKARGDRALSINATKASFYCFFEGKGGDVIALVAHVRGTSQRDAAAMLQDHFVGVGKKAERATSPAKAEPEGRGGIEHVQDRLAYNHELVQDLGVSPAAAEKLGVGYCSTGQKRNRVLIPIRDQTGELLDYAGWNPELEPPLLFSPNFDEKIIPFRKRA